MRRPGPGPSDLPRRGQPGEGRPPLAFHGSTIRFYDPAVDAWRSTWIEPVNGRVRRFVGRAAGGDIVLLSDEDDRRLRRRFTDIDPQAQPDSFTWQAETSHDGGRPTTVWNRSGGRADVLVAKGAGRAATVADAVSASPLVVVCLTTYDAVHEVLDPVGDALSGRVLVNLTNGTPRQARDAAAWAAGTAPTTSTAGSWRCPR